MRRWTAVALLAGIACGGEVPAPLCAGYEPPTDFVARRFAELDRSGALGRMSVTEVWSEVGELLHRGPPPDSVTTRAIVCALRNHPAHWRTLVIHFLGTPAMSDPSIRAELTTVAARLLAANADTVRSLAGRGDVYVWHSGGVSFAEVHPDPVLVPGVIASLDDPPPRDAYQASTEFVRRQGVLVRLTGVESAPYLEFPSDENRARAMTFWNGWWSEHARGFDIASQNAGARAVREWRGRRGRS